MCEICEKGDKLAEVLMQATITELGITPVKVNDANTLTGEGGMFNIEQVNMTVLGALVLASSVAAGAGISPHRLAEVFANVVEQRYPPGALPERVVQDNAPSIGFLSAPKGPTTYH